ncbi:MAG: 16S rRNA (guanine(527)-N(7))-methyltransferase RsmG [Clostridia bacterium]|nr:16S rRNA (guanine(527)-N(7))-methyltransferase RsmG [Clostridia bacterium]
MVEIQQSVFCEELLAAAEKNGVSSLLNGERAEKFFLLTKHMLTVNESFNLTAIKEPRRIIFLHYIDCLLGASFFPLGASVIDVGCGAGFPSLPLAICRPDLKITGLDATGKKAKYVKDTASLLGLSNVDTVTARAEDAAHLSSMREAFDCATARAVAGLPVLCEICLPFVKKNGLFIAMKGKNAGEELEAARSALEKLGAKEEQTHATHIHDFSGETFLHTTLLLRKKEETPALYPRPYAKILKKPL